MTEPWTLSRQAAEHWPRCPYCDSEATEVLDTTHTRRESFETGIVGPLAGKRVMVPCLELELRCSNCGGEWVELYQFTAARPVLVPQPH